MAAHVPMMAGQHRRATAMADATLKEIMAYFNTPERPMGASEFRKEWKELDEDERFAIKRGLGNGSLTY